MLRKSIDGFLHAFIQLKNLLRHLYCPLSDGQKRVDRANKFLVVRIAHSLDFPFTVIRELLEDGHELV